MSDIVEFLKARLDEDEALAIGLAAECSGWQVRDTERAKRRSVMDDIPIHQRGRGSGPIATAADMRTADHIARHDPVRVLREVEAKRKILAEFYDEWPADCDEILGAQRDAVRSVLRHLASAYSDHPDYPKV